jgi:hypothetical protein
MRLRKAASALRSIWPGCATQTHYLAQIGYVLLTYLVYNLLADFHQQTMRGGQFEGYGLKRIYRDLLATPGSLTFDQDHRLLCIKLFSQKQFSEDLLLGLLKCCSGIIT